MSIESLLARHEVKKAVTRTKMSKFELFFVITAVIFASAGQLLLKKGAELLSFKSAIDLLQNFYLWAGLSLYVMATGLWVLALRNTPLSRVYPFTLLIYILVIAGSTLILGEKLSFNYFVGMGLVLAGLVMIVKFS